MGLIDDSVMNFDYEGGHDSNWGLIAAIIIVLLFLIMTCVCAKPLKEWMDNGNSSSGVAFPSPQLPPLGTSNIRLLSVAQEQSAIASPTSLNVYSEHMRGVKGDNTEYMSGVSSAAGNVEYMVDRQGNITGTLVRSDLDKQNLANFNIGQFNGLGCKKSFDEYQKAQDVDMQQYLTGVAKGPEYFNPAVVDLDNARGALHGY
jgi:hypothetical protein